MSATERMARFIAEARLEEMPEVVITAAKTAILDTVGVMAAAVGEPVASSIVRYVSAAGGPPDATVVGSALKTSTSLAALANGALGHALDFDDLIRPISIPHRASMNLRTPGDPANNLEPRQRIHPSARKPLHQ